MNLLFEVLTPANIVTALLGGFLAGWFVIADAIRDPRFGQATASGRYFGRRIALIALEYVGIFYLGQIASGIADADASWPRAAARFVVFIVFAVLSGAGAWAALRRTHP